jgi:hypothetical protein
MRESCLKVKSQKDFWSGLMFVAIGVAFAWASTGYNFGQSARPGPGYFPFGLGVLLALLGGLVLFKALTIESDGGDLIGSIAWRPLIVVLAAVGIFGYALPRLGMVVTLPLLIVIANLAGDGFKWKEALLSSVVLTAGSWVIFIWGLGLTIPLWPIFLA